MLSKSKIVRGLQCNKALWLYTHHYDMQDKVSANQQAVFDTGNNVGELAQQLWPGGVDASEWQPYANKKAARRTQELLAQGQAIIYEATFIYNGVLVAIDILVKENGVWNAFEVKSSTSVKDVNIDDASIQYYVITNAGIAIENISIVHIATDYVRKGPIDLKKLFAKVKVTDKVLEKQDFIKETIRDLKEVVEDGKMPEREIGLHCTNPYNCNFMGTCWKDVPDYSVFDISNINKEKAFEMYHDGMRTLSDIPNSYPLTDNQRLQVDAENSGESKLDKEGIEDFINNLEYPLYFFDYESINPVIPMYDGQKPYRQILVQYSIHKQNAPDEDCTHAEFLAESNGQDQRETLIKQLIKDCGATGDILVYSIAFERSQTLKLATSFPQYAKALNAIANRFKDLMLPFQHKLYYTPEMLGRHSIKTVLPALVPELSYKDLAIGDGRTSSAICTAHFEQHKPLPIELQEQLLAYCKMDTWAMVKILEKLREV